MENVVSCIDGHGTVNINSQNVSPYKTYSGLNVSCLSAQKLHLRQIHLSLLIFVCIRIIVFFALEEMIGTAL